MSSIRERFSPSQQKRRKSGSFVEERISREKLPTLFEEDEVTDPATAPPPLDKNPERISATAPTHKRISRLSLPVGFFQRTDKDVLDSDEREKKEKLAKEAKKEILRREKDRQRQEKQERKAQKDKEKKGRRSRRNRSSDSLRRTHEISQSCPEGEDRTKLQLQELQIKLRNAEKDNEYYQKALKQLEEELEATREKLRIMEESITKKDATKEAGSTENTEATDPGETTNVQEGDGDSPTDPPCEEKISPKLQVRSLKAVRDILPEASLALAQGKVFQQKRPRRVAASYIGMNKEDRYSSQSGKDRAQLSLSSRKHNTATDLIPKVPGYLFEREFNYDISRALFIAEREDIYKQYFYKLPHRNFIGIDTPLGTVIVSAKKETASSITPGDVPIREDTSHYRVLLQTQDGDQTLLLPSSSIEISGVYTSSYRLLNAINPLLMATGNIKEIEDPLFCETLLNLEAKDRARKYKIGVLLVKEGQTSEREYFKNLDGSKDWHDFLDLLGDEITLEGFTKFNAGLDVKLNTTGRTSRFVEWKGNEVMFHVSTLLPFNENDPQQLERKRHIGNDIVLLVFLDGPTVSFSPKSIASHFIHCIIAVRRIHSPDSDVPSYVVSACAKEDVPICGPPLPHPSVFKLHDDFSRNRFREFLYAKTINSELAAQRSFYFSKRLRKGRNVLLDDIASRFSPLSAEDIAS